MQNAVGIHVKGKGHRTPGAVWPWHWIGDHGLSSSACKRMRVSTGAYAYMPQDTTRALRPRRPISRAEALSRATGGSGAGAATVPPAGDTEIGAPGGEIQGSAHTSAH